METLEPMTTLKGDESAYCEVCWDPVYKLWVGPGHHGGKCLFGETDPSMCMSARNRAKNIATIKRALAEDAANHPQGEDR